MLKNILVIGGTVLGSCLLGIVWSFHLIAYYENIQYMDWRVQVERENLISDVQSMADEMRCIELDEPGYQLYGRDWRLWDRELVKESEERQ